MLGEERKETVRGAEVNNFLAKRFPVMAVTILEEGPSSHSCFNYFTPAIL